MNDMNDMNDMMMMIMVDDQIPTTTLAIPSFKLPVLHE
jgi:hypothetical protein